MLCPGDRAALSVSLLSTHVLSHCLWADSSRSASLQIKIQHQGSQRKPCCLNPPPKLAPPPAWLAPHLLHTELFHFSPALSSIGIRVLPSSGKSTVGSEPTPFPPAPGLCSWPRVTKGLVLFIRSGLRGGREVIVGENRPLITLSAGTEVDRWLY